MELRDKIAGALYGMALGDAMGMPAELWGRERARKFFGGKITEFIDGPKENDVAFILYISVIYVNILSYFYNFSALLSIFIVFRINISPIFCLK